MTAHRLISFLLLTLEQVCLAPHKETGKPRLKKKGNSLARESNKRLSRGSDPGRPAVEFVLYNQVPFASGRGHAQALGLTHALTISRARI